MSMFNGVSNLSNGELVEIESKVPKIEPGTKVLTPKKSDGTSDGAGTVLFEIVQGNCWPVRSIYVKLDSPGNKVRLYPIQSLVVE